jgi:hypothetical protein
MRLFISSQQTFTILEPTTKPMELANFFAFWLQNTTSLLQYGKSDNISFSTEVNFFGFCVP